MDEVKVFEIQTMVKKKKTKLKLYSFNSRTRKRLVKYSVQPKDENQKPTITLHARVKVGLRSTQGRESKANHNNPWTSKGRAKH